jgi:hypothetical protein
MKTVIMKDFLNKLSNKSKTDYFPHTVILGNSGASNNTNVGIWTDGAILNNMNPTRKLWNTDGGGWDTKGDYVVRHTCIGDKTIMSKADICKLMGIKKLISHQGGFKAYPKTPIGPVLYFTVDTDEFFWTECVEAGVIDKKRRTNIESNFGEDMSALNDLMKEVV